MKNFNYYIEEVQEHDQEIFDGKEENLQSKIIKFIQENPNPKDKQFHEFADSLEIEPDELETEAYKIISDILTGGKSKGIMPEDADPKEIEMGSIVEAEHTSIPELQMKIVADHLTENPKYYSEGKAKGIFDELK